MRTPTFNSLSMSSLDNDSKYPQATVAWFEMQTWIFT